MCIGRCHHTATTASVGPINLSVVSGSATVSIILQLTKAQMIATLGTMLLGEEVETVAMTTRQNHT